MKSIYARKQLELFLDEEERSIQEESEQEGNKIGGDRNNTPKQSEIDIGMIGAIEETLEGLGVRPRKCPHLSMNPWKEQSLHWRIGFKEPAWSQQ